MLDVWKGFEGLKAVLFAFISYGGDDGSLNAFDEMGLIPHLFDFLYNIVDVLPFSGCHYDDHCVTAFLRAVT